MLNVLGDKYRLCDGLSRRSVLKIGGLAMGGLSLPDVLRAESQQGRGASHKSVIMISLSGGPPHQGLAQDPDTVRAPDIAFIQSSRIPAAGLPKAFWPGAPDLAVEVLSPNDIAEEVEEKVNDWLDHGCDMVWVVSPKQKTVTVYSHRILFQNRHRDSVRKRNAGRPECRAGFSM